MNIREKLQKTLKNLDLSSVDYVGGIKGSAVACLCSFLNVPLVAVAQDELSAEVLMNDIIFYQKFFKTEVVEILPYPSDVYQAGRRARVIYNQSRINKIVSYPEALLNLEDIYDDIEQYVLNLNKGQLFEREALYHNIQRMGYTEVSVVAQRGDFCMRNWVLDVFPSSEDFPLRIEFFGDVIEAIRFFRIDTQRSIEHTESVTLYPAQEIPADRKDILWIDKVSNKKVIFDVEGILKRSGWKGNATTLSFVSDGSVNELFKSLSGTGIMFNERESIEDIPDALKGRQEEVVITLPHYYQAKRVSELFDKKGVFAPVLQDREINAYQGNIVIAVGNLSEGLYVDGLLLLTQKELFGRDLVVAKKADRGGEKFLENFEDIAEGDFVVHKEHGIGKFRELSRYRSEGADVDVAVIEYAEKSILYIPLYNIQKIHKYRAGEGAVPALDKIGGKTWDRKKRRMKKKIDTMVRRILELYAQREVKKGFAFSPDTEIHREFYSFFAYEETDDQIRALREIYSDMERDSVMDRLLCGDVGFGKTEVAMRAAFKTLYDGKQVAIVVPTTVLCEQHYRNFRERFSAFPVVIDYLSRFKTSLHNKKTMERIRTGEIDVIVATHSLLRKKVAFNNLGLLIIDEEHRFGVAQKEMIKELKKGVDCLMLSATPIPRTLQMALSGIRKMSVMESPPEERLSVRTFVSRFDKNVIREAVYKEISREGQIFFVHNRVEDISKMKIFLKELLPDVRIVAAHGQLKPKELEKIMIDFMNYDFDMLLCTSIIGSGIDIPRANTIFVNMADRFGLADLHQLKGRVGRGNIRAYAFFLMSPEGVYTEEGKKRLKAIEQLSYLGAGLKLALKDLEIRGAGILFGYKQSGYIHELGFDMYMDMLRKEVEQLKGDTAEEDLEPEMDLNIIARIPESVVSDDMVRLSLYRRLSVIKTADELEDFRVELEDRFGKLPEDVERLLTVVSIKNEARKLGIKSLTLDNRRLSVTFISRNNIPMERYSRMHEKYRDIRFRQDGFELTLDNVGWLENMRKISDMFDYLSEKSVH